MMKTKAVLQMNLQWSRADFSVYFVNLPSANNMSQINKQTESLGLVHCQPLCAFLVRLLALFFIRQLYKHALFYVALCKKPVTAQCILLLSGYP